MRIPITKYGLPQVAVFPAIIIVIMAAIFIFTKPQLPTWALITVEAILLIVLIWALAFFRDPYRQIPQENNILLAPADGLVSDIAEVDDKADIGGKALRIGIFLNIFNVHINRTPCAVTIDQITYKKGKFINAMNPDSGKVNESNEILMTRLHEPADKLLVRQVSGAIARRIVCAAKKGDKYDAGEKFGMIKFGSRTELYLPIRDNAKLQVKIGDKVKAGQSILVRYE